MKTLMINGSPHKHGCTFTALSALADGLQAGGVDSEIAWIGQQPINPCTACGACRQSKRCAFGDDDGVNALIEKALVADALVFGSPVHYAGISGSLKSTLDRLFFAVGSSFAFKPGGAVVSARRAGTTAALEQLNKYFLISQMLLVGSFYWPMVHGQDAADVAQDEEGVQTAYQLGANIAWLLKTLEVGKAAGITPTVLENRAWTNFVR